MVLFYGGHCKPNILRLACAAGLGAREIAGGRGQTRRGQGGADQNVKIHHRGTASYEDARR